MKTILSAVLFLALQAHAVTFNVVTVAGGATYAITCTDDAVVFGSGSVGNLPSASDCPGKRYSLKKGDTTAQPVFVNPVAGQTIDHMATLQLPITGDGIAIFSDGANWNGETQYQKNRPYSHRTVTAGAAPGGSWNFVLCRDNSEMVRVDADGTANGIGIYLDPANSACNPGDPYVNTAVVWIMNVGTDSTKPVSIWPYATNSINGATLPIFLKQRYEGVQLYTDGNEWFILDYVNPSSGPSRSYP